LIKIPTPRKYVFSPTPVHFLPAISKMLGLQLWIKRDDQTGLAGGGNKTRKLEWLMADALQQGATRIITAGAIQSNHCRQTAAAAAIEKIPCTLLLSGSKPHIPNGNHLLDLLFGAELIFCKSHEREILLQKTAEQYAANREKPYIIPIGGSNKLGALAYLKAIEELNTQMSGKMPDRIVIASSSGGTQAGIAAGIKALKLPVRLTGIRIDKMENETEHYVEKMCRIANEVLQLSGFDLQLSESDFDIINDYLGGGYGVMGHLEESAIRFMAHNEGILLDPVYTGRAFGAFLDMAEKGAFSSKESILFWHTGGSAALFGYADKFSFDDYQ
jgi:L-cysteate sulfo-lyase